MKYPKSAAILLLTTTVFGSQVAAQDTASGQIAQNRANNEGVNNGTNPTLLSTKAGIQYQYNQINSSLNAGLWEAFFTVPFGAKKNMALELTLPYANGALNSSYGLGDVSLKFVHVVDVNAKRGLAYTAEYFADTADRPGLGNGQDVLELSAFYASFQENGGIFAPAWVQTIGLEGTGSTGSKINRTTIDFYYVPKLSNPKYFMTLDPALVYDWETEKGFASLQVTFGMLTGKAFGGDSQVFIKPGIYAGKDRPLDFSLQVGYKVLNF